MAQQTKMSEVIAKCRETLCGITVTGPFNARALATVYDDLCMVEQYMRNEEGKKDGNPKTGNTGNV